MGMRAGSPLVKGTVRPSTVASHCRGWAQRTVTSTADRSNSGTMCRPSIYRRGTASIHTVCQMPLCGVYQMPPRRVFCLPRL